jgi:hypothetical protein
LTIGGASTPSGGEAKKEKIPAWGGDGNTDTGEDGKSANKQVGGGRKDGRKERRNA